MIAHENRILWLPGEARSWDDDGGGRSPAGVRISPENATAVATVFSCARILAETVASLPLHILERLETGGKRQARELPLYKRLHSQPNSWQTSFEWREQAVFHVCLWGDAYSEIRSGSSGAVDQLIPLHPSRMKVETLENGSLRYTYREAKGRQTIYTDEQILHLRGPSDDGVHGMSIVEECREAIALARACEIHGSRFFGAGARPGFILSTDNPLNADARRELADNWNRKHRGPQNAFETAVLTGGLKPYEIPYATNTDSQFLELRQYQLAEIARLFRVPMHLLGVMNGGYGSIEHAGLDFVQHTILPWLRRFESAFTRDLIVDDEKYFVEFDVRGLLRGDSASRSAYYRAMWDIGALSTNDILELENRNPVEGGDVRYRPLNMGTLGEDPTAADAAAQQQPGSGIDGQAVEGATSAQQLADASLNGAQIAGILQILQQIASGFLSKSAAVALLAAAYPNFKPEQISAMVGGIDETAPPPVPEPEPAVRSAEFRAAPGTVAEGDFVSWDSSGGRARGRIDHVMDYGTLDVPGTDFTIDATEDDPAALITVYEEVSGGWRATETQVGHKVATLTKIDPLPEPPVEPVAKRDCGTGAGGFKPGNKCAGGGGGGGGSEGSGSGGGDGGGGFDGSKSAREFHAALASAEKEHIAKTKPLKAEIEKSLPEQDKLAADVFSAIQSGDKEAVAKAASARDALNEKLRPVYEKLESANNERRETMARLLREQTSREVSEIAQADGVSADAIKTYQGKIAADAEERASQVSEEYRDRMLQGHAAVSSLANPAIHEAELRTEFLVLDGARANFAPSARADRAGTVTSSTSDSVFAVSHEVAHALENNPEVAAVCRDFASRRTAGESPENMQRKFGGRYRSDEEGRIDNFAKAVLAAHPSGGEEIAYYAGKTYSGGRTEILSIGMEMLANNPAAFARADREWFDLCTGVLTGRLLPKSREKAKKAVAPQKQKTTRKPSAKGRK